MITLGAEMGGHVRVGLEDNLYLEKGVLATRNAQFVEQAVQLAAEIGREVATPVEARDILGLPSLIS
jgi:3-keto-5-aminohexanoate cleavage enzyme